MEINQDHNLNDPKAAEWKNLLNNLTDYQKDENGLRIGRDVPFDKAHRHYSHLLGFYPLFDISPDNESDLLRKSTDHWLKITKDPSRKTDGARSFCGYTATGAASMYAALKDGNRALYYLNYLRFNNVSSTTMYSEGNPVIESPFSAATSIHDMLLQSWDGKVRVMPGVPDAWENIHFRSLLCQGGVVVSAAREQKKLVYVLIESPKRNREIQFSMKMEKASFELIEGDGKIKPLTLSPNEDGFYRVSLQANQALQAISSGTVLSEIKPVKSSGSKGNIFGFNKNYDETISAYKAAIEKNEKEEQMKTQ